ncbi:MULTISPECIES: hypothetical protein [Paenibacillus]|uniref:Uncharacterized protein n=1 Tax=Paenibacillus albilobatus TaxID=2716884 RepID=A0A920CFF7_9BACL|nr:MULTISPECIES: hypothetical protein [Paenibacillus]GIO34662.1 hypothetical protein J2TS6_58030 [Paenibacillus albilobatus]
MSVFNSGWFGTLIGIVGILVSIYFYRKDKIGARLDYQMAELKILDHNNLALGMTVNYFDKPITRLIKTQIVIWNSGQKTIDGNEIVIDDQLKFSFDSSEVLSCNIVLPSREINKCVVKKDEMYLNSFYFNFDFLDPKDGAVIEILHTGEEVYPKFSGSIKGMKDRIRNRGLTTYPIIQTTLKKARIINLLIWIISLIILSLFTIGVLYLVELISGNGIMDNKISLGIGISLGSFFVVNKFNIFKRKKAPKNLITINQ